MRECEIAELRAAQIPQLFQSRNSAIPQLLKAHQRELQ